MERSDRWIGRSEKATAAAHSARLQSVQRVEIGVASTAIQRTEQAATGRFGVLTPHGHDCCCRTSNFTSTPHAHFYIRLFAALSISTVFLALTVRRFSY